MPPGVRLVALCAVSIACFVLAPAATGAEHPPMLVAQLAQAQPEQPELSEDPPTELEGDQDGEEAAEPEPAPEDAGEEAAPRERELARTGSEAGTLALVGFALLGWGVALRLRLRDAA